MNTVKKHNGYTKKPGLSFEFYPPRTARMENKFWRAVGRLEALKPDFFSVTYGALGSGREQSLQTVKSLCTESNVPVAAHLTCVDSTRNELNTVINELVSYGIDGIVALRGDGAEPQVAYTPTADGYQSVPELVRYLGKSGSLSLSVAAYPEVHPQAASAEQDIQHLKAKLDAGADRAITQYFYNADAFLRFRDRAVKAGIEKPIVPGILPIHDYERVLKFSQRCGATVPGQFAADYERLKDDALGTYEFSVKQSVDLCRLLIDEGVDRFHFYTLNLTDLSHAVCCELLSVNRLEDGGQNAAA